MFKKLVIIVFTTLLLASCYGHRDASSFNTDWNGIYTYSTYRTNESTGTGIGESYTLTLADNRCNVDIVGYQVDKHFACYLETTTRPNYINIYDLDNKTKFGEVKRTGVDDYLIKITYFDEYNEPDNNFYSLDKKWLSPIKS